MSPRVGPSPRPPVRIRVLSARTLIATTGTHGKKSSTILFNVVNSYKQCGQHNSREICLSMRKISLRGHVEIACACGKFINPKIYVKMRAAFLLYLLSRKLIIHFFFLVPTRKRSKSILCHKNLDKN